MNINRALITIASLGLGASLLASSATAAAAASPSPATSATTLAALKARASEAVQDREKSLAAWVERVNNAKHLTAKDRAALLQLLQGDESGLNQLNAKIQADTTLSQARTDAAQIVLGYRVYLLVEPQVHLVIAADAIAAVDDRLEALEPKLEDAIEKANVSSDRKEAARKALADLRDQVAAAEQADRGVSEMVLDLTPAGYPGNKTTLEAAHDRLQSAREHLEAARQDAHAIASLLKS